MSGVPLYVSIRRAWSPVWASNQCSIRVIDCSIPPFASSWRSVPSAGTT